LTFKYLGIRLFAHPWDSSTQEYKPEIQQTLKLFKQLDGELQVKGNQLLHQKNITSSCVYNSTLINYVDPSDKEITLIQEPYYNIGTLAIGWHSDRNLVDYSNVGVYNCSFDETGKDEWKIALKVRWDIDTPSIVVPLKDGDVYFMLYDFNHKHQHAVVAGNAARVSSTHRLVKTEQGTWQYIINRAIHASELFSVALCDLKPEDVKFAQDVHSEIEFEWIRQFWVQGASHAAHHNYWLPKITELERIWKSFEEKTCDIITLMRDELVISTGKQKDRILIIADVLCKCITLRQTLRREWEERYCSPIYLQLADANRPVKCPTFDESSMLPEDLTSVLNTLYALQSK